MSVVKGEIREDVNRDIYWTKIHFESEDKSCKSTVLACASWEYILDANHINEVRDDHLKQWQEGVIKKWESFGDKIFDDELHYDVYATTPEGKLNGEEFLKIEVKH